MAHKERSPALMGSGRASDRYLAGQRDNPSIAAFPANFQSIGAVGAATVRRTFLRMFASWYANATDPLRGARSRLSAAFRGRDLVYRAERRGVITRDEATQAISLLDGDRVRSVA